MNAFLLWLLFDIAPLPQPEPVENKPGAVLICAIAVIVVAAAYFLWRAIRNRKGGQ